MRYSTTSRVPYTSVTPQGPPHKIDSHFEEHYDIRGSAPFPVPSGSIITPVGRNQISYQLSVTSVFWNWNILILSY